MSDFRDNQKVQELHNRCGKLQGQMNALLGNEHVPGDQGIIGQLRETLVNHRATLDSIQKEILAMMELQKENRMKLAGILLGISLLGTFAGSIIVKLLVG